MNFTHKKGFTLIELLVVIAIIGVLAAVVLTSLSGAKNKARDGSIKTELSSIAVQAEVYYDRHSGYTSGGPGYESDSCYGLVDSDVANNTFLDFSDLINEPTNAQTQKLLQGIVKNMPEQVPGNLVCNINNTGTAWVISVKLNILLSNGDQYWCVDSSRYNGSVQTPPSTGKYSCQ